MALAQYRYTTVRAFYIIVRYFSVVLTRRHHKYTTCKDRHYWLIQRIRYSFGPFDLLTYHNGLYSAAKAQREREQDNKYHLELRINKRYIWKGQGSNASIAEDNPTAVTALPRFGVFYRETPDQYGCHFRGVPISPRRLPLALWTLDQSSPCSPSHPFYSYLFLSFSFSFTSPLFSFSLYEVETRLTK